MKARIDAILRAEQAEYLERLLPANTGLLEEMEQYAAEHRVPVADREVARFLEIMARAMGARRVLEVGMAIGYSVVHLARALPDDGEVVTIEPSEKMIAAATRYLDRAGLLGRVRVERGYALEVIPRLEGPFDILFLDALKEEYADYLELALPLLRKGGVVIADNLLWGGQVAGEIRSPDQTASTQALRAFNQLFVRHPQLLAEVLPLGDGLGYGVKLD
jgi:caffeoyl-CoA O-methyltransferase